MVWSFQLFIVLGVENEFEVYGASSMSIIELSSFFGTCKSIFERRYQVRLGAMTGKFPDDSPDEKLTSLDRSF